MISWSHHDATYLHWSGGPYQQAERLRHKGRLRGERQEHEESHKVIGLLRHPVHYATINDRKDYLKQNKEWWESYTFNPYDAGS